jgi:hypothetical protein
MYRFVGESLFCSFANNLKPLSSQIFASFLLTAWCKWKAVTIVAVRATNLRRTEVKSPRLRMNISGGLPHSGHTGKLLIAPLLCGVTHYVMLFSAASLSSGALS